MKRKNLRSILAFSLIELLISLIAISSVTAAFAPVISKRLSGSILGVSGGNRTSSKTCDDLSKNCVACQDIGTPASSNKVCLVCSNDKTSCTRNNQFVRTSDCQCIDCSTGYGTGCNSCDSNGCLQCLRGYYLNDKQCSSCPAGYYCEDGKRMTQCPKGAQCSLGSSKPQMCSRGYYSSIDPSTNIPTCAACGSLATTTTPGSSACTLCSNLFGIGCSTCTTNGCTSVADSNEYSLSSGMSSSKNYAIASGLSNISSQQANILSGLTNITNGVANMATNQSHTANSINSIKTEINTGLSNIAASIAAHGGSGGSSSSGDVQKMMLVHNCDGSTAPHCKDGCNASSNSCLGCAAGFGLNGSGKCVAKPANCSLYNNTSDNKCTKCNTNFGLHNGTCALCSGLLKTYSSSETAGQHCKQYTGCTTLTARSIVVFGSWHLGKCFNVPNSHGWNTIPSSGWCDAWVRNTTLTVSYGWNVCGLSHIYAGSRFCSFGHIVYTFSYVNGCSYSL